MTNSYCNISGIQLFDGDMAYFVPLTRLDNTPILPVLGYYCAYNHGMGDMVEDANTKFLEEYFGLPIENIIGYVSSKNSIYTEEYILSEHIVNALNNLHFTLVKKEVYDYMADYYSQERTMIDFRWTTKDGELGEIMSKLPEDFFKYNNPFANYQLFVKEDGNPTQTLMEMFGIAVDVRDYDCYRKQFLSPDDYIKSEKEKYEKTLKRPDIENIKSFCDPICFLQWAIKRVEDCDHAPEYYVINHKIFGKELLRFANVKINMLSIHKEFRESEYGNQQGLTPYYKTFYTKFLQINDELIEKRLADSENE